jgi:glycosyltransferase involved in cell wall biosynthesis
MTEQIALNDGRKLRILIFIHYYFPHRTGLTIHVQQVAEELVQRGHEVTVITTRYSGDLSQDEDMHNGVRVIRLWAAFKFSRGMVTPALPWAAYLAMREADIVSIHTPTPEMGLVGLLAKIAGVNVVATHHGDLVLPQGFMNRIIQGGMFLMYKYMAQNAAQLIGYSQDYANHSYYLQPFLEKTIVNYPPVTMPEPQQDCVAVLRRKWQKGDAPIIGYSGRFVLEKRPELAILALETINKQYPDTRLVFAGEYDIAYEDTWQNQQHVVEKYKAQLIFLGLLEDRQELANFYAACDVIILPSDTECFALVQVEAMLCATPMVMTDIAGGRVPVQVTGMGKLAKQGDAVSIGQAVLDILNEPEKYHQSREHIESIFSFEETVNRYEETFRKYARPNHA